MSEQLLGCHYIHTSITAGALQRKQNPDYIISRGWLNNIENGTYKPSLCKLYALGAIYNVHWSSIFSFFGCNVSDLAGIRPGLRLTNRRCPREKFIGKKRRIRQAQTELSKKSLELGVFGLGLLEDGDIGVGVFP